jgi:Tol biopolymer transport system component
MLVSTRFGQSAQVHRVRAPGGARYQLTFFPDTVAGASYEPARGDYFVFARGVGGNERFQLYRYDLATGDVTLLTDGKSRHAGPLWATAGGRMA